MAISEKEAMSGLKLRGCAGVSRHRAWGRRGEHNCRKKEEHVQRVRQQIARHSMRN